jgi:hypothetical protein
MGASTAAVVAGTRAGSGAVAGVAAGSVEDARGDRPHDGVAAAGGGGGRTGVADVSVGVTGVTDGSRRSGTLGG